MRRCSRCCRYRPGSAPGTAPRAPHTALPPAPHRPGLTQCPRAPQSPQCISSPSSPSVSPAQPQCSRTPRNLHSPALQTSPVPPECSQSLQSHQHPSASLQCFPPRRPGVDETAFIEKNGLLQIPHRVNFFFKKQDGSLKVLIMQKKWWVTHWRARPAGSLARRDPWIHGTEGSLARPGVAPHTRGLKVLYKSSSCCPCSGAVGQKG